MARVLIAMEAPEFMAPLDRQRVIPNAMAIHIENIGIVISELIPILHLANTRYQRLSTKALHLCG